MERILVDFIIAAGDTVPIELPYFVYFITIKYRLEILFSILSTVCNCRTPTPLYGRYIY